MKKEIYLVYIKNGDTYLGEREFSSTKEAIEYVKRFGMKYAYTGSHYTVDKKYRVIVGTTKRWDEKEKAKRKKNGFLYIREHALEEG